jgi:hypothetical protein
MIHTLLCDIDGLLVQSNRFHTAWQDPFLVNRSALCR